MNPSGSLQSKVAIVTGGSRGLGFEIARQLLDAGSLVAICSRNAEQLHAAASTLCGDPSRVIAVPTDVASESAVATLFESVVDQFGRVDILVNNAGNFDGGPVEDVTLDEWNNVMGACLTGPFLCTREAFRWMKPQGGGRILNIGSISAQRSRVNSAPYTASKFGVWGLTQATALEGREHGIVVSCLHPGNILVDWRRQTSDGREQEPMMTAATVARAALSMLALPDDVNLLEAIVLPSQQLYLGRG
jgi:NAD(P)-dependent dehydrogenase (short-subunit alcohol dehydrogenase family)